MTFVYIVPRDTFIFSKLDNRLLVLFLGIFYSRAYKHAHTAVGLLLQMGYKLCLEYARDDWVSFLVTPSVENNPIVPQG